MIPLGKSSEATKAERGGLVRFAALTPVLIALALAMIFACGAVKSPPVEVLQRDSLLGIGKILIVSNPAAFALEGVELRFENPNGDVKNYRLGSLGAGEEIEVGWKKLDGFEVSDAAKVEVRATGYGRALILDLGK